MTDKKKMQDIRIWQRMGQELCALDDLLGRILCDPDYQAVMGKKTWNRLYKAIDVVNHIRSDAEERMARNVPNWSTRVFYPVTTDERESADAAVAAFRKEIKKGCI